MSAPFSSIGAKNVLLAASQGHCELSQELAVRLSDNLRYFVCFLNRERLAVPRIITEPLSIKPLAEVLHKQQLRLDKILRRELCQLTLGLFLFCECMPSWFVGFQSGSQTVDLLIVVADFNLGGSGESQIEQRNKSDVRLVSLDVQFLHVGSRELRFLHCLQANLGENLPRLSVQPHVDRRQQRCFHISQI